MADGGVDRVKLEKELSSAVERERTHHQVDEMKKRAIGTAASYEEFKNLVACAGLKPLARDDFSKKAVVTANKMSRPTGRATFGYEAGHAGRPDKTAAAVSALGAKVAGTDKGSAVRTPGEFDRAWRRLADNGARFRFLQSCDPCQLQEIFSHDLDATLLVDIIACANDFFTTAVDDRHPPSSDAVEGTPPLDHAGKYFIDALFALSRCSSFAFTKKMLSKAELTLALDTISEAVKVAPGDAADTREKAEALQTLFI